MTTPKLVRDFNSFLARWFPVDYNQYIHSPQWKRRAEAAKERALYQCQGCGRPQGIVTLSAHHRTYTRLGYEVPEDLTVLCMESCHPVITQVRRRVYNIPIRLSR